MRDDWFFRERAFADTASGAADMESAQIVVLPVPYSATTDWQSNSKEAPASIISAARYLETYDMELDCDLERLKIHVLPELVPDVSSPEAMINRVYEVTRSLLEDNKPVAMLGGEHSLTLGTVQAYTRKYPKLSVLQLDAHADLRNSYQGSPFSHASVMRRVGELCPVVAAGIRSLCLEEKQFISQKKLPLFPATAFTGTRHLATEIIDRLPDEVYITIDMDVFDPSEVPAVGTPEPGGWHWYEVIGLLREVARRRRIVGFDVVELCPSTGQHASTYLAAKLVYKLMGYMFYGGVQ